MTGILLLKYSVNWKFKLNNLELSVTSIYHKGITAWTHSLLKNLKKI